MYLEKKPRWVPLSNRPATVDFLTEYLTYVYHDQKRITAASSRQLLVMAYLGTFLAVIE